VAVESFDTVEVDGDGGRVRFKPVHKDNEGKYTCRATNDVRHATASGQLIVRGLFISGQIGQGVGVNLPADIADPPRRPKKIS